MVSRHETDRAYGSDDVGALILMGIFDPRMENRPRDIEQHMLPKRRVSDAEPEGTDGQVTWANRLRQ